MGDDICMTDLFISIFMIMLAICIILLEHKKQDKEK